MPSGPKKGMIHVNVPSSQEYGVNNNNLEILNVHYKRQSYKNLFFFNRKKQTQTCLYVIIVII